MQILITSESLRGMFIYSSNRMDFAFSLLVRAIKQHRHLAKLDKKRECFYRKKSVDIVHNSVDILCLNYPCGRADEERDGL